MRRRFTARDCTRCHSSLARNRHGKLAAESACAAVSHWISISSRIEILSKKNNKMSPMVTIVEICQQDLHTCTNVAQGIRGRTPRAESAPGIRRGIRGPCGVRIASSKQVQERVSDTNRRGTGTRSLANSLAVAGFRQDRTDRAAQLFLGLNIVAAF